MAGVEEFELDNYEMARSYADEVYAHATRIHNVFEDVDGLMRMLHGSHWESAGSQDVNAEYLANIKSQFEPFYEEVVSAHKHIHEVVDRDIATDNQAAATIL